MRTAGWLRSSQQGAMYGFTVLVSQALCTVLVVRVCSIFQETAENGRKYKSSCNNAEAVQMELLVRSGQNTPWDLNPNQIPWWRSLDQLLLNFSLKLKWLFGPKCTASQRNCTGSAWNTIRWLSLEATVKWTSTPQTSQPLIQWPALSTQS